MQTCKRFGHSDMITADACKTFFKNGLWTQNAGLVQLLGLCPLLAMSTTVVNSLSLGLATTLVMVASSGTVSGVRRVVPHDIRLPVFMLIIATFVTLIELALNAYLHALYLALGIFIPLIATNCIVLARIDAFASKNPPAHAIVDALAMGLGVTLVLALVGGMREIVGNGSLFSGMELVFGANTRSWVWHPLSGYDGFLLAILPPGAFIALGLLIAARNWLDMRAGSTRIVAQADAAAA